MFTGRSLVLCEVHRAVTRIVPYLSADRAVPVSTGTRYRVRVDDFDSPPGYSMTLNMVFL